MDQKPTVVRVDLSPETKEWIAKARCLEEALLEHFTVDPPADFESWYMNQAIQNVETARMLAVRAVTEKRIKVPHKRVQVDMDEGQETK